MRAIEDRSEQAGVSTDTLMENAGLAVARAARRMAGPLTGVPIVVLVGPGNNGADGLVAARHLQRWGARVTVYLCRGSLQPGGETPASPPPTRISALDLKLDDARNAGVEVAAVSDDPGLDHLRYLLGSAHLVIDAMLGTGRARPIEGVFKDILEALSSTRNDARAAKLLALDLPTGLDCDTAEADPACVAADVTVALGYPKRGHLAFPGAAYVGRLEVAGIGIPPGLDADVHLSLLTPDCARAALPNRPGDSHKGTFGRTMIVAGSRSFLGAAYLAAASAARVGAGLVTIAIPASLVSSVAPSAIEPTFLPLPESNDGVVSAEAADLILDAVSNYSALLIGCGLGQADDTRTMVERLLLSGADLPPTVADADGLNTLARIPNWPTRWPTNAILTPHPGEMARLVNNSNQQAPSPSSESTTLHIPSPLRERARACPVPDTGVRVSPRHASSSQQPPSTLGVCPSHVIPAKAGTREAAGEAIHEVAGEAIQVPDTGVRVPSRLDLALTAARDWRKTVVLKGAYTVVAHPDGSAHVSPFANPGLATAGTGDVLAGAIAGLLSQGLEPETAASLGMYLHGLAGESVRDRLGDTGMIASDLLPALPTVIRDLR